MRRNEVIFLSEVLVAVVWFALAVAYPVEVILATLLIISLISWWNWRLKKNGYI